MLRISLLSTVLSISTWLATSAYGQEVQYELVDAGVLSHNVHGKGIELQIQPSALPDEGLSGIGQETLANVCRFYAPNVIPFVEEKTGFEEAEFVAVRMVSGNATFGKYVLQIYTIEDNTCGEELN